MTRRGLYPEFVGYRWGWASLLLGPVVAAVALSVLLRWMGMR